MSPMSPMSPTSPRRSLLALAAAAAILTAGCGLRRYDVKVHFTPEAADRRLARGQSDVVRGQLARAEGGQVHVTSGGETEPIPAADIGRVEQHGASQAVRWGAGFAVGGVLLSVVSAFYFDCGPNDFPVFCAFKSESNFWAGLTFLGGIALAGAGVGSMISGSVDKSRNAGILRDAGVRSAAWWLAPAPVATHGGGVVPGVAAGVHF